MGPPAPPNTPTSMRICFLSRRYFPTISGMSVYADNLVRQLAALGHDVTMVSQFYGGDAAGVYGGGPPPSVPGVRVVGMESVGEQSSGDFEADIGAMVDRVAALHAEGPFDVIHAQYGYPTGYAALLAARRLGRPCVVSIQGGDGHWVGDCCGTHRTAMRLVCDHADALLIGSGSFASEVHGRLGTNLDRFTIVPGAVDTRRFRPADGREPGDLSAVPHLLCHGRVDRRKGVFEAVGAYRLLRAEGREVRLTVSGIGPDYDEVRRAVADLPGATATGYADYADAPDLYRTADAFVSPTHAEGFSNTILEAMATGLPVVSCRAVGVVDCLAHEENGLLAEVGDVDGLARQIARVLDDAPLRRRLASRALEEARTLYSWESIAGRIAGVYGSLAGTSPDGDWTPIDGPPDACRFRSQPHLL